MAHPAHSSARDLLHAVIPAVFAMTILGQPIPVGDEYAARLAIGPSTGPLSLLPRRLRERWCVQSVDEPARGPAVGAPPSDPRDGAPETILMPSQPMPREVIVGYLPTPGGLVTAITRLWAPEDRGRCRLCPLAECRLSRSGTCQVMVQAFVAGEDAALFARPGAAAATDRNTGTGLHGSAG